MLYWICTRPTDETVRRDAEHFLKKSSGVFDNCAHAALYTLATVNDPVPQDYFMRGYILRHNVLGEDNITDTVHRRRTMGAVVNNYDNAIQGMLRGRRGGGEYTNDFMLREMERIQTTQTNLHDIEDVVIQQLLMNLATQVTAASPVIRKATINERIQKAADTSTTRSEAVEKYFDSATVFTDDKQNVHDSKINSDLRIVLNKIKSENKGELPPGDKTQVDKTLNEIREYITNTYQHENKDHRAKDAIKGLDKAREGGYISSYNDNEDRILAHVWKRTTHPLNADNTEKMKEAIVTSLADGIENNTQVCINGRCSRVLNSLVTLDYDPDVSSGVMTLEAYRNQAFQETKKIITDSIERAKKSDDKIMREVGEAYDNCEPSLHAKEEEQFKNSVKEEIDENLRSYTHKLNANELSALQTECYAYATI